MGRTGRERTRSLADRAPEGSFGGRGGTGPGPDDSRPVVLLADAGQTTGIAKARRLNPRRRGLRTPDAGPPRPPRTRTGSPPATLPSAPGRTRHVPAVRRSPCPAVRRGP